MGTITQRKLVNGAIRFRAEIRINRKDLPAYKESKTFGSKKVAAAWLVQREAEIEQNPEILFGQEIFYQFSHSAFVIYYKNL